MLHDKTDNNRNREWVGTAYTCTQNSLILRKMLIVCLNTLYSIVNRHFAQHADAEINVPQVALVLCEIKLISVIILSTFMSFLFLELVKRNI
jgi:hypothetical protein